MTRVYAVSDTKDLDPTYAEGLRKAVAAAVEYGLSVIELGERRSPPPPPILLAQARVAASAGVNLDTVLRRYVAGHSLVVDVMVEEAEQGDLLEATALRRLLRAQAALFERLLAVVAEEHRREAESRPSSSEARRRERVERLLAGELVDGSELGYDLDAHHLGLMARGDGVGKAMRELAARLDRHLLAVCREDGATWACWLGGRRRIEADDVQQALGSIRPPKAFFALGEPGEGMRGWQLTHRQAKAALPMVERAGKNPVRYADVALLASMLQDDLLATSLREIYLAPLEGERGDGGALRKTLRAYFAAERNVSSAAGALGLSRHTVASRLRLIEERLGRSLNGCAAEMEAALRLEQILQPV
jgi:DNA-binding PucR family transcriptional regulator